MTSEGGPHPVLIVGIMIFVIPFLGMAVGWNIPTWFSGIGVVVILIGGGLSVVKNF